MDSIPTVKLDFYQLMQQIGFNADSNDLDHVLNSLPWVLKEIKPDGTKIWEIKLHE